MSNPYQSMPLTACFDGESQPDDAQPVEVTDTQPDGTQDTQPVEAETPEPEPPTFTEADLEQRISERLAAVESEWQAKLNARDSEVAAIRTKFDAATVERTLSDAAVRGDAFSAEQVLPLLRPHTTINADGLPVVQIEGFVMTPVEAIAWMRAQVDRYGNLFKSRVIPGIGGHSTAGGARAPRGQNVRGMDAATYRAAKRENPSAFGFTEGGVG